MGSEGSGNWYRFDKKTTTDECQRVDVRYLHREGLLNPGHWFSLRWSRADRETGSIRAAVIGDEKPEKVILTYRHRSGPSGEWEDVQETCTLHGRRVTSEERGRGSSVQVGDAVAGLRFCTHQGATSCAVIATTSVTKVSAKTRCTGP
jgi:hypothetical protein